MRKISKELLLIVICLIIIMLLCADIITDFFTEPHSWFNSSFAINSKVQFSQQKQPVHLPAGSQSGVGLQPASQQNRDGGCFIERKILPLRSVTETETTSYLTHTTDVTQQKYNNNV